MNFVRFARTFCQNVGTFSANLCKLFPNLRIRNLKDGQETSKLGIRMNRFDCNDCDLLNQPVTNPQDKPVCSQQGKPPVYGIIGSTY